MKLKLYLVIGLISMMLAACGGGASAPENTEVQPAPDFTLPNALGGEVSLSDYAGEPVFLFFHMAVG
jgi:cytochrome oxidase Cu insertion factor (SCO1/SenC/PrrC family)